MESEPSSTPKLSLFSFPSHTPEPAGMVTPPLRTSASVPFVWEEAPGKPRTCDSKPNTARCLDLPPRLLSEVKITSLPSPTTVLDGPYASRSATFSSSFREIQRSLNKSCSPEKKDERFVGFWSKKKRLKVKGNGRENSLEGSSNGFSDVDDCVVDESKVKITRFKRSGSFLNISNTTNHLWASIYGSVKQVVPWRSRRLKKDRLVM
eukprot:TRINITY_DN3195_c0_g1_i2.p1 TRINITY_DN3195_c0_g1~~TRINITY_DN3195_c0_g1_i2.p1  ORF type:complete len:224 (+),score=37.12 TRINITY_DN3195_c0_g1_i2:52-672(+)